MAGAWEIPEQVLTVVLTRETVATAWAIGFRNLQIPGHFITLAGMPFDHARNVGCQRALEMGFDGVVFLDDDIIAPPDTIPRLLAHKTPVVSGLYYRRNDPICPVMLRNNPDGSRTWVTEYPPGLIEVDYVGAGCLLIRREVLLSLPPLRENNCHWFEWRIDRMDLTEKERMSEDFAFCQNCTNRGYKIFVDTTIQCKHAGLSESKYPGVLTPLAL